MSLPAPPLEYSLDRNSENQPYSEYTIDVTAPGYEPVSIAGAEILPDVTALQQIHLNPAQAGAEEVFVIPAHTLYGNYPPKIPEAEIKPMPDTGEIVLSRVVVPEYVVVHNGSPRDSTARNYYVRYKDYIKNVASSEIYATLAGRYHPRQRAGYHVFYPEQGLHRMVPGTWVMISPSLLHSL